MAGLAPVLVQYMQSSTCTCARYTCSVVNQIVVLAWFLVYRNIFMSRRRHNSNVHILSVLVHLTLFLPRSCSGAKKTREILGNRKSSSAYLQILPTHRSQACPPSQGEEWSSHFPKQRNSLYEPMHVNVTVLPVF